MNTPVAPSRVPVVRALSRRFFLDSRTRNIFYAVIFFILCYSNAHSYQTVYTTLKERLSLARGLGTNKAVLIFYGKAYNLLTTGGYVAWRVGGVIALAIAVWGILAATRAMRAEEEAGRSEGVLAGVASRRLLYCSALLGIGVGVFLILVTTTLGLGLAKLSFTESVYMAAVMAGVAVSFVGVGALFSQLAETRRLALSLSFATLLIFFVLRVIADTSSLEFLRWLTPLGWAEEARPFTGAQPLVLLLPLGFGLLLLFISAQLTKGRDVGTGVLSVSDSAEPRLRLLSSATAETLRQTRSSLLAWTSGTAVFALVIGLVSTSVASAVPTSVQHKLRQYTNISAIKPSGYIGFSFLLFVLLISIYCCVQVSAARREESEQRVETLLSMPLGRIRWLGGRVLLAAGGAVLIGLVAGFSAWLGAAVQGASISLPEMLEAGLNCLPISFLLGSLALLALALLPRASTALGYGIVAIAFLWDLFGQPLNAPNWAINLTPFHHLGLVPAEPLKVMAALVMLGSSVMITAAALALFRRRDLIGN